MRLTKARLPLAAFFYFLLTDGCRTATSPRAAALPQNVVLVCEHGNVKSLIAASLFNQIASARGLPFRAQSRGLNPESSVPAPIVAALQAEGIDVSTFVPRALSHEDAGHSSLLVGIGVDLTAFAKDTREPMQLWSDVPPARGDYALARAALIRHVEALLEELSRMAHEKL